MQMKRRRGSKIRQKMGRGSRSKKVMQKSQTVRTRIKSTLTSIQLSFNWRSGEIPGCLKISTGPRAQPRRHQNAACACHTGNRVQCVKKNPYDGGHNSANFITTVAHSDCNKYIIPAHPKQCLRGYINYNTSCSNLFVSY